MESSDPRHDAVQAARERYFALCDQCAALEAELSRGTQPSSHGSERRRDVRLSADLVLCRAARDAAHAALGRTLLERFAEEVKGMTASTKQLWRQGGASSAREAAIVEDQFRRACLGALAAWPELAEEAQRRLAPSPGTDGRVLH